MHEHFTPDDEGVVEGYELFPLGKYHVKFEYHDFIKPLGLGDRIRLWFVITSGEYKSGLIPYFCPIIKTGRKGGFTCRKGSKYKNTLQALTGREGQRRDRFSPSLLKGMKLVAETAHVKTRKDKSDYSEDDHYSKVKSLEREE
jgi:hypothetical protein